MRSMFSWKCRDCGMTSSKEPHRRLEDHMDAAHGKVWSDRDNAYIERQEQVGSEHKGNREPGDELQA